MTFSQQQKVNAKLLYTFLKETESLGYIEIGNHVQSKKALGVHYARFRDGVSITDIEQVLPSLDKECPLTFNFDPTDMYDENVQLAFWYDGEKWQKELSILVRLD